MRRPRRTATFLLAGGLVLGTPALAACSEDEPAVTNETVENDVEDLDDEGAVDGVGETPDAGGDEQVENDVEDLDDEGAVEGVEETPSG